MSVIFGYFLESREKDILANGAFSGTSTLGKHEWKLGIWKSVLQKLCLACFDYPQEYTNPVDIATSNEEPLITLIKVVLGSDLRFRKIILALEKRDQ